MKVNVIGAGLAGSEAAWQLLKRGCEVTLYEMKPEKYSPAHHMQGFAKLVCSNSLRSDRLENAVGLLKEEMRRVGSLIMDSAEKARVPAGGAMAVDRETFSAGVTDALRAHPGCTIVTGEVTQLPEGADHHRHRPATPAMPLQKKSCASREKRVFPSLTRPRPS